MNKVLATFISCLVVLTLVSCGGAQQTAAETAQDSNIEVSGTVLDSRGVPIDGASLTFSEVPVATQTDIHGYFSQTIPSGAYTLAVAKDGTTLKELTLLLSADMNPLDLGEFAVDGYLQPAVWPAQQDMAPYQQMVAVAVDKYQAEGQNFAPFLNQFEPFGDFCNWSTAKQFHESDRLIFDESGLPKIKYGSEFFYNPVTIANFALHLYGRYLQGEDISAEFLLAADKLVDMQRGDGALPYEFSFRYYVTGKDYPPGWVSGMAQGQALSVFARAYQLTGQEKYLQAGNAALAFLTVPLSNAGVFTTLKDLHPSLIDYPIFEEYPAEPATYTLNGFMFTLLGLYSWGQIAPDAISGPHKDAQDYFSAGVDTLEKILPYYDIGGFSVYDLGYMTHGVEPHVSTGYHRVHIYLLHALYSITGRKVLEDFENLWASYVI